MMLRKLRQSMDFDSNKISELDELQEEPPKSPKIISPEKTGRTPNGKAAPTIAEKIANGDRSGASSPAPSDGRRCYLHVIILICNVAFMQSL